MNNPIIERIKKYLTIKSLSLREFERICGLGNGVIGRLSQSTKQSTLNKISSKSDLNVDWLLSGEGPMLKDEIKELSDNEMITFRNALNDGRVEMVPVIHIDSVGGIHSTNEIMSPEYIERYIPMTDARKGDVIIRQTGSSMSPAIPSGAYLLIREVEGWYEYIGYGDVFVLLLNDGRRITKEIRRYDENPKEYFWCVSYNPEVADEELPRAMVVRVWKVIKVLIDKGW